MYKEKQVPQSARKRDMKHTVSYAKRKTSNHFKAIQSSTSTDVGFQKSKYSEVIDCEAIELRCISISIVFNYDYELI